MNFVENKNHLIVVLLYGLKSLSDYAVFAVDGYY